jgi:subtilisin family serine protease
MTHDLTHYWHRFVRLLLGTAMMAGLAAASRTASAAPKMETDQIIVQAKPGRDIALIRARGKGTLKKKIKHEDGELEVIQLPAGIAVDAALAEYRASADVEFAEPDYVLSIKAVPNDPRYADGSLWALNNTGQRGGLNDADMDAPEAWEFQSSAANIIVAVVDSGVRYTHEDLAANMWRNPAEVAGNGRDDDANGYIDDVHGIDASFGTGNPLDENGHGTHVAGIIAAVGNNGRGSVGVAWSAQIMALKFLDSTGNGYTSDAIEAIDYARRKGAKVINASFAGPEYSTAFRDALLRARSAGVVLVAAAGNETANNDVVPTYPASYAIDNVVTVAATSRTDALASFSNFGAQSVHLAAPGASIYSTYFLGDNSYVEMAGTSMAAPQVAGAVALVRAFYPAETYRQALDRILKGVDVLPGLADKVKTGGRLNLHNALKPVSTSTPTAVKLAMLPDPASGHLRLRITGIAGQVCLLEQSTDLVRWGLVSTVTLPTNGLAEVIIDLTATPRAYYRGRSL